VNRYALGCVGTVPAADGSAPINAFARRRALQDGAIRENPRQQCCTGVRE
jgi:hypothetical protein